MDTKGQVKDFEHEMPSIFCSPLMPSLRKQNPLLADIKNPIDCINNFLQSRPILPRGIRLVKDTTLGKKSYFHLDIADTDGVTFFEGTSTYTLSSHHISVYEHEDGSIAELSQYHYTAYFTDMLDDDITALCASYHELSRESKETGDKDNPDVSSEEERKSKKSQRLKNPLRKIELG